MANELALTSGGRVLDVGCGTGWFTRRLSALPGMLVTGIDLNAEWLAFRP
ncbi:class I SAM-dependent methyltransferase [Propionivibrio sp.]|nr:class I SAM-dependent methyltransferase [Propionivibrio sp.]